MELTNKLRSLRMAKGVTQEQLAREIGVTAQAVSKWERGATMPDVSLLPELSVYFGVSLDELFGLTEDKEYERIQNMIWDERVITHDKLVITERRIDEMIAEGYKPAECMRLRADLYNHRASYYHSLAEESAKAALDKDPDCPEALGELNEAMGGFIPDWNARNHFKLIAWLKDFVKKNPESWKGWLWLLDNLIDDGRFAEAEEAVEGLAKADNTYRTPLYRAILRWRMGDREKAHEIFKGMEKDHGDEWFVFMSIAEHYAMEGDYAAAVEYTKKAMAVQKAPRYVDTWETLAQIYEIMGDIPSAIEALEDELKVFKTDWDFEEGETADKVRREIARLKAIKN